MRLLAVLAARPVTPDEVGAGPIGFVVIGGIAVATYLLWRNMNKQLRKVRFEEDPPAADADEAGEDRRPRPDGEAGPA